LLRAAGVPSSDDRTAWTAVNPLLALLALAVVSGAMVGLAWLGLGRQGDLLTGLYRAPDLGWPRGVQEEDPPPSWRWSARREPGAVDDEREALAAMLPRTVVRAAAPRVATRRGTGAGQ
jgi:hypothetical protein